MSETDKNIEVNSNKGTVKNYESLNAIIAKRVRDSWDLMAFSDMGGHNYRFRDVAEAIEKLRLMFEAAGVKPGDKIALCGKNSSNWAVTFLAAISSGIVAVPILHEFKPETVHHLINHSGAKLLFVDQSIWEKLDEKELPGLVGALYIAEYGMPLSRKKELTDTRNNINERFGARFPYAYDKKDFQVYEDSPEELAVINYTSGSTGMSKGVMLPYSSIWSNVRYCLDNIDYLGPGDGMVNMLPLAHLYGLVVETLHPFCRGMHCHFLTRLPSPKVIIKAFEEVKPKLIITVPLIVEKIVKSKVFPMLEKPLMRLMVHVPFVDDKVYDRVRSGLINVFGGQVREIIIGGAALNKEVGTFLNRIGFPVTVGYGMTECGPLITYSPASQTRLGTCGRCVSRMEMKVDSPDPRNIPGDLWVRGMNVMQGYYNNPEATEEVMMGEGWMNTGDMCTIDADGFLTISGRSKTMILGPSGQNIYPEEIEQKLNNLPYVAESIVIDDHGELVALVVPDFENIALERLDDRRVSEIMDENLVSLNRELPSYSKVKHIELQTEEFEKTPKRSIKRFLYQR
ncbi:MAG: long-chain fatty acid--CoA ligase [Bacteroides sp.]|nr:long-chain fatty acid--CoA ligase [Bacteroides sp.]